MYAYQEENENKPLLKTRQLKTWNTSSTKKPIQCQKNNTGIPDHIKQGTEQLSGFSLDHVKVHYNSPKPAQLNAHAYAQGNEIHMAPGQDKHIAHETWHVVQQMQGRVQPTTQFAGQAVNDDAGLEREADVMGDWAASVGRSL